MWMRPVTLVALLVSAVLGTSAPAVAQQPTEAHVAAARELLIATGASGSIDDIVPALLENIRRQSVTRPELAKDLDEVLKALAPDLETQKQQALNLAARAYAKWLTEAEIRDALAFFRSPSGVKYVRVQPDLTEDVVQTITSWSQLAAEYVMARTRSEMAKRGHQMQ